MKTLKSFLPLLPFAAITYAGGLVIGKMLLIR